MRFAAPLAVLQWRHDGHDVHQRWRSDDASAVHWLPVVEALCLEAASVGKPNGSVLHEDDEVGTIVGLAVPLLAAGGRTAGAIAIVVDLPDEASPALLLGQLTGMVSLINTALLGLPGGRVQEVVAGAGQQPSLQELGDSLVGTLRARCGAVQAAFGLIEAGSTRLLAVSGIDDVPARSAGSVAIRQAMEECADRAAPVASPPVDAATDAEALAERGPMPLAAESGRLHEQWRQLAGGACLASIPIPFGDGRMAVVSLLRSGARPFDGRELATLQQVLGRLAPSLEVMRRSTRSLPQHLRDGTVELLSRCLSPSVWRRRLPAIAAALVVAWVLFGHMDHTVTVSGVLQPERVVHVSAPREARLLEAGVREGDTVANGQVLCRFDDTELVLRRAELVAEIESLDVEGRQEVADGDLTAASLVGARRRMAASELASVEHRIAQTTVTAAFAGRVIQGDLSQRIGQVLPMGEPLFEIATAAAGGGDRIARLELHVPEYEVLQVVTGAPVRFVGNARPDAAADFRIERLVPAAEVVDGRNVFRAVARLATPRTPPWARPGMEGVAEIALGREPVRVVLTDRLERWVCGWFRP